jgi:hypothetical protein
MPQNLTKSAKLGLINTEGYIYPYFDHRGGTLTNLTSPL